MACWEKEFEAAQFQGGYTAVVDFTVEGGSSKIRDPKVRSLEPDPGTAGRDASAFKGCIEAALGRSALPAAADQNGPGFHSSGDVRVQGFRIAFTDSATRKRTVASERQANVLIGPRADRCQGLYSHDPPRDASTLYDEIAQATAQARDHATDPDLRARELQKEYDAQIELADRLVADLAQPGLPEANRTRTKKALAEAIEAARKTGAKIGCTPKAR